MRGLLIIMLALFFEHLEKALPLVEKYSDDGQILQTSHVRRVKA